jgi:flagellar biosynthetic protein FliR
MRELVGMLGEGWIVAVLLLSTRVAAALLFTPVLYAAAMPALVRVLLVVALSCALALPFAHAAGATPADWMALAAAGVREATLGATLGLGVLVAFAGFALAGRLLDVQVGFGMAQVLDPLTRSRVPVLSSLFAVLAAVFFFLVDGHHALLRGLAYSIERFPPGQGAAFTTAGDAIAREVAALFGLGFALAAPVILALLLVEFALGVLARTLPQMNVLLLGLPVKIVAGLLALSLWIAGFGAPASRLYAQIAKAWAAWFAAEGAR